MKSKRIVITRAVHQADALASLLEERGAIPLRYPCIAIEPVEDTRDLDSGIRGASRGDFDWIVLTSANTVMILSQRFQALGIPRSDLARSKIAAIGPGTAEAVDSTFGCEVTLLPEEYEAEGLADSLCPAEGSRVFLPQSNIARPTLMEILAAAGADVVAVAAYRTVMGSGGAGVPDLLARGEVDAVTFTSSSTVENFVKRLAAEGVDLSTLETLCIACLGRKTEGTARELGLTVSVTPRENTLAALVNALEDHFAHTNENRR